MDVFFFFTEKWTFTDKWDGYGFGLRPHLGAPIGTYECVGKFTVDKIEDKIDHVAGSPN